MGKFDENEEATVNLTNETIIFKSSYRNKPKVCLLHVFWNKIGVKIIFLQKKKLRNGPSIYFSVV